jgi:glucose-6-phosphate 1-dehydrogenase
MGSDLAALPSTAVIFGANGDLTKRKLIPALYRLRQESRLPRNFAVLGISRTPLSDDAFRARLRDGVERYLENSPFDAALWDEFAAGITYLDGDLNDPALYTRLAARLTSIDQRCATGANVLFYLSIQPSQYAAASRGLAAAGLHRSAAGWRRILIEKPFGRDLASARELGAQLQADFPESSIYRIDHYLGKETVQNILALRFGNSFFEPLWKRGYVDHVQITGAEAIGVEGRGAYYQETGALRDMLQNHLLQVLATVAMEPPAVYEAEAVRNERAKLLQSITVMKPAEAAVNAVTGQYGPGQGLPGFREEPGVDPAARTDTYAALTLFIDNWRWAGVPFYLRSGKRMARRVTEVAVQFKAPPLHLFEEDAAGASESCHNALVLKIQPEEGASLRFFSKTPGLGMKLQPVHMEFDYGRSFEVRTPSAYETLLLEALTGDRTLYTRQDMVEASWRVVEPVLEAWANSTPTFPNYAAGSWGPTAADEMLARRGHTWRKP